MQNTRQQPASPVIQAPRLFFIDNIRWVMILLVLSMHAAVTYSNQGGWYYCEKADLSRGTLLVFIFYQSFLQSFFMGLLFFIAGYFVPKAFDAKGPAIFLKDRAYRLGLPTLLYVFIIGPLTEYFISHSWHPDPVDRSFTREYKYYITRLRFPGGTGPLWFCEALLIFCAVYALYRIIFKGRPVLRFGRAVPGNAAAIVFMIIMALSIFLVRIPFPKGYSFYNLQLCYFAGYLLFFMAGIAAYRGNWLQKIPRTMATPWAVAAFAGGIILWLLLLILGGALNGNTDAYNGGLHLQSLGLAFWESMVGVGMSIFLLVLFRKKFNRQGRAAKFFSANAFAVYVFHPPILIGIALMMGELHWHPLLKFILLTVLSFAASFVVSAALLRKIPGLKKIL